MQGAVCEGMVKYRRSTWSYFNTVFTSANRPTTGRLGGSSTDCFGPGYTGYAQLVVDGVAATIASPANATVPVRVSDTVPGSPQRSPPDPGTRFKTLSIDVVDWLYPRNTTSTGRDPCLGDGPSHTWGIGARTNRGTITLAAFNCSTLYGAAHRWQGSSVARGGEEFLRSHIALAALLVHELVHAWDAGACWAESVANPSDTAKDEACFPPGMVHSLVLCRLSQRFGLRPDGMKVRPCSGVF